MDYLRLMPSLKEEIGRLSRELQLMAKDDEDVRLLMSVPGVGYYTALLLKVEVGKVGRFPSKECLCSFEGLVPSEKSSGEVTRHGRIAR